MRNLIVLFTFFSLLGCKDAEHKMALETSKEKDINEIIKVIIIEDSLKVAKGRKDSRMLCADLVKLTIYVPEKAKNGITPPPPPPSFNSISIDDLLQYPKPPFFSTKDSLHLLQQNSGVPTFTIDAALFKKINLTTREQETKKREAGESFNFYELTIPIFSLDHQTAYVTLNHYCGGLCGSGVSIYLKKVNGKWKIMEKRETWIS